MTSKAFSFVGLISAILLFINFASAQSKHTIEADEVRANLESGNSTFIGNVVVIAPEYRIESDKLQISFITKDNERSINDMVATGNVRMRYADKQGFGERLEYDANNQIFTLRNNAKLIDSQGVINAPFIQVNQKTQDVKIESTPQQRVRLTFEGQR